MTLLILSCYIYYRKVIETPININIFVWPYLLWEKGGVYGLLKGGGAF